MLLRYKMCMFEGNLVFGDRAGGRQGGMVSLRIRIENMIWLKSNSKNGVGFFFHSRHRKNVKNTKYNDPFRYEYFTVVIECASSNTKYLRRLFSNSRATTAGRAVIFTFAFAFKRVYAARARGW